MLVPATITSHDARHLRNSPSLQGIGAATATCGCRPIRLSLNLKWKVLANHATKKTWLIDFGEVNICPMGKSRCSWVAISQLTYRFFHQFVSFGGQRQSLLHSSHLKIFRVPRSYYVLLATMGCCRMMWYHYATNDLWLQHLLIKQKTMARQQIPQRFPGLPLPFLYSPKGPRAPPQCLAETPGVVLTSWRCGIGERASPSKTQWPKYQFRNTQQSIFLDMNVHIYSRYKLDIECIETITNDMYIYIYIWRCPKMGVPLNHPFINGFFMK